MVKLIMLEIIQNKVRLLGQILGQTIVVDCGEEMLKKIEHVRHLSKELGEDNQAALKQLQQELATTEESDLKVYAHAFSQFLNLVNIAEQQFMISEKGLEQLDLPHPLDALSQKMDGLAADKFKAALEKLHIELVLTAHPTEVNRRTFIHKYHEIAEQLGAEDECSQQRIAELIEQAWFTNEIRLERPTPLDESGWGLDTIADSLWHAVPIFLRELNNGLVG